jgi:uncharacterized protein YcsI (UPF0317 family)
LVAVAGRNRLKPVGFQQALEQEQNTSLVVNNQNFRHDKTFLLETSFSSCPLIITETTGKTTQTFMPKTRRNKATDISQPCAVAARQGNHVRRRHEMMAGHAVNAR